MSHFLLRLTYATVTFKNVNIFYQNSTIVVTEMHVGICVSCVCIHAAHRLKVLQVDVLVAEAVEAYNVGELQPEVTSHLPRR